MGSPVKGIADKVASNFNAASVWAVDAAKLPQKQLALHGMSHARDEWKPVKAEDVSISDEVFKHTANMISDLKYLGVVDFDDHLNDASLNWLNPTLFKGNPLQDMPLIG